MATDELDSLNQDQLEQEKLREEIRDLRTSRSLVRPSQLVPIITVVISVGGLIVALWKQMDETRRHRLALDQQRDREVAEAALRAEELNRQRTLDRDQREKDLDERKQVARDRFDERFGSVVANLGSSNDALSVSATAVLGTFLRDRYIDFRHEVFRVLVVNVKVDHTEMVNRELVRLLGRAIRLHLESGHAAEPLTLDLDHASLQRLDISGLEIPYADLAYSNLKGANLSHSRFAKLDGIRANFDKARVSEAHLDKAGLKGLRAVEAHFHGTRLVGANLRGAHLEKSEFNVALLQSAHLEGARLADAVLTGANLADTYLKGARLDRANFASANLRNAHLEGSWLEDTRFDGADLARAHFWDVKFATERGRRLTVESIVRAHNWEEAHFADELRAELRDAAGS